MIIKKTNYGSYVLYQKHPSPVLAPQEQALLALLRWKEKVLQAIDSLRPKIIFKHDINYYRSLIFGEVYVEDLLKALHPPGRVVVTY